MVKNIFTSGLEQSITDILASRDRRVAIQHQILQTYPHQTLVDIKLNIPGPIKNNSALHKLFTAGYQRLEKFLGTDIKVILEDNLPTGNEVFLICRQSAEVLKQQTVIFEERDPLGRLFDLDVLSTTNLRAISRSDLDLPMRKCFLCQRPAKECARSRRHSISELQNAISRLYQQEFQIKE